MSVAKEDDLLLCIIAGKRWAAVSEPTIALVRGKGCQVAGFSMVCGRQKVDVLRKILSNGGCGVGSLRTCAIPTGSVSAEDWR
jgi:hypothetical protein